MGEGCGSTYQDGRLVKLVLVPWYAETEGLESIVVGVKYLLISSLPNIIWGYGTVTTKAHSVSGLATAPFP